MSITVKAFKALQGDSLLISYNSSNGEVVHIVVDAGLASSYHRTLKPTIAEIIEKGETINLAIVSHYDNDHIQGFIPLLKEYGVEHIDTFWFNYCAESFSLLSPDGSVGVEEGIQVRDYLIKTAKVHPDDIQVLQSHHLGDAFFTILSPEEADLAKLKTKWNEDEMKLKTPPIPIGSGPDDKHMSIEDLFERPYIPDKSKSNKASIAFVLRINEKSILLTSDASASTLISSIRKLGFSSESPLKLDLMQVPHHGSSANTSSELVDLIDCRNFLVSTNPINGNNFPHKVTLARIVKSAFTRNPNEPIIFHFNYDHPILRAIFTLDEIEKYHIECNFPSDDHNGILFEP
jgi:beta-lactamase superfamily II metal-dependent hydrolase